MKKLIDFTGMVKAIQDYADSHCEGNFSMAARILIRKGLKND